MPGISPVKLPPLVKELVKEGIPVAQQKKNNDALRANEAKFEEALKIMGVNVELQSQSSADILNEVIGSVAVAVIASKMGDVNEAVNQEDESQK
jgi:hypothetical protein